MLLLSGPPGSGKTHSILEQVRVALRREAADFRLVVPSASMAEHLRGRLVREGFAIRPELVVTFSRFTGAWVTDIAEMSALELDLIIEKALEESCPPDFSAAAEKRGFRELIARLVDEFSSAGYESRHIGRALGKAPPDAPLAPAFLRLYEEIEKLICSQLTVPRHMRLRRAADDIRSRGLGPVHRVFFDGFADFSHPELDVIHAMRSHADVTVTLPRWPGAAAVRSALLAMGLEEVEFEATVHRFPVRHIVRAPDIDGEVADVARRILDHADTGRQLRDIGIVLRSGETYVPALRATLERHGIPAHFHFAEPLAQHAVVRYLTGCVEAMLAGWRHEDVLAVLKMTASGFGNTEACDRLDFAVHEGLPAAGLAALRRLSGHPRLGALLDRLGAIEAWAGARALPAEWALRARGLRCLLQLPEPKPNVPHETALLWRAQARALDGFLGATDEAARAFAPHQPLPFSPYWDALKAVLRSTRLDLNDRRRNVVHVMDVHEARHWDFQIVFVCGLMEEQFPRYSTPDPIFPDAARARLRDAGIRVRTAASQRDEEEFLFEVASTRATSELVFTYPEVDGHGRANLPSFFLERFVGLESEPCMTGIDGPGPAFPERDPYLRDPQLIEILETRHEYVSPAAIETFAECPLRFFLSNTLALERPPAPPDARLNSRLERSIVRQALVESHKGGEPLEAAFDRSFRNACMHARVPNGASTELARIRLWRELRKLAGEGRPAEGWRITADADIEFTLDGRAAVRARIDRFDVGPDNQALVFDYSGGRPLQAALGMLGIEQVHQCTPAGVFLRSENAALRGWHLPLPHLNGGYTSCTPESLRERIDAARADAVAAVREIRRGRVEPWPGRDGTCRDCEYACCCDGADAGTIEGTR